MVTHLVDITTVTCLLRSRRLLRSVRLANIWLIIAGAFVGTQALAAPLVPVDQKATATTNPGNRLYQTRTDREITQLTAAWGSLNGEQRRALLTELKHRMAVHRNQPGTRGALIRIQTKERYGNKVRIRTKYVAVRRPSSQPLLQPGTPAEHKGFGTGFENRVVVNPERSKEPEKATVPVITVNQKQ